MDSFPDAIHQAGIVMVAVAVVWSFVAIFRENPVLAVVCLLLPLGLPIALLMRWPRTWRPLAAWLIALALFFGGLIMLKSGS